MPKKRKQYPLEYRRQMVDLVRSGRSQEALAHEFGRRDDGTTTHERDELRRLKRENANLALRPCKKICFTIGLSRPRH